MCLQFLGLLEFSSRFPDCALPTLGSVNSEKQQDYRHSWQNQHFSWCDNLSVHSCCCKWHCFILFLWLGNISLHIYIYHIFSRLSTDGHLGCLNVLAIVNSAAVNMGCMYLFDQSFAWLCAQEWDCWIIWHLYFQFFEESLYCFPQ